MYVCMSNACLDYCRCYFNRFDTKETGFFIAIFKAVLNPVINITVFGEIVKFGTPNL